MTADECKTLSEYVGQYRLRVVDLVLSSGRSRATINTWWINDKDMIRCILKACLLDKFLAGELSGDQLYQLKSSEL